MRPKLQLKMGGGNVELPKDGSQGPDRQSGVGEALHCYINQSIEISMHFISLAATSSEQRLPGQNELASQECAYLGMPLDEHEPPRDLVDC